MLSANPYALTHSFVGADAHIGPLGSIEFAAEFCKNGANCRANVGIGLTKAPLGLKGIWHEGSEGI